MTVIVISTLRINHLVHYESAETLHRQEAVLLNDCVPNHIVQQCANNLIYYTQELNI
jgi:hypothetical protein